MAQRSIESGRVLGGRYRIDYKIGEGGFGDVYRATTVDTSQTVAVKTLRQADNPELPDLVQRFEREFTLAAKLRHPSIVAMYDYGQLEEGTLYMAMEYVEGEELERVLRRESRLTVDRAGTIVLQMLDALAAAHQMGVVHRDLKPSNVMLTKQGLRRDIVKLLDFGVAKAVDGTYADLTAQNLKGSVGFGTPQYMAPEQIFGQDIGSYTDLYAVGLILIELVTGTAPMLADDPTTIIQRQIEDEVPVPEWLQSSPLGRVLERALVKDWRHRYRVAAEMYRDLERALSQCANAQFKPVSDVDNAVNSGSTRVVGPPSMTSAERHESGPTEQVSEIRTMLVSQDQTVASSHGMQQISSDMALASPADRANPTMLVRAEAPSHEPHGAPPGWTAPGRPASPRTQPVEGVSIGGVVIPTPLFLAAVAGLALVVLLLAMVLLL